MQLNLVLAAAMAAAVAATASAQTAGTAGQPPVSVAVGVGLGVELAVAVGLGEALGTESAINEALGVTGLLPQPTRMSARATPSGARKTWKARMLRTTGAMSATASGTKRFNTSRIPTINCVAPSSFII